MTASLRWLVLLPGALLAVLALLHLRDGRSGGSEAVCLALAEAAP